MPRAKERAFVSTRNEEVEKEKRKTEIRRKEKNIQERTAYGLTSG